MEKNYFVMLNHPTATVVPLMETDDDMAFFETNYDAVVAGFDNSLGSNYGFEVFELGGGDSH